MSVPVPSQDQDFKCHMLSFLCSMIWGERWLLVLLILVELLTINCLNLTRISNYLFMFNDLRREVIAGFVDIGGTADNQLFELDQDFQLSFYVQWFEERGDCWFCWYWWNCWQSIVWTWPGFPIIFLCSMIWGERWLLVLLILVELLTINCLNMTRISNYLFMFNDLRREVIAGFVDIGGTADNQLFELDQDFQLSFYVQWFEERGDCWFCWYWWNCWQSIVWTWPGFPIIFLCSMIWGERWLLVLLILVELLTINCLNLTRISNYLFMFNDLRREVIAGFVDIGGTADNQLFELDQDFQLSFYVQWFEERGDCWFCWYWWNCWQSIVWTWPGFPMTLCHMLSFYVQWFEERGDCWFCWYWWNCWQSIV